ncbi:MarR family winged helix-turn-helix transcriptional regulator [Thermincola ferriacetica]
MNKSVLDKISEDLLSLFPLLHKKLLGRIPTDQLDLHLPPSALQILFVLHDVRISTVSAVCNQLNISRPNMTPLLDKLVEANLVDRRTNEEDRRVIDIQITPEGDQVISQIQRIMLNRIKTLLGFLPTEDLQSLAGALQQLKTILSKLQPSAEPY